MNALPLKGGVMRTLILKCKCGLSMLFLGATAGEVLEKIDTAGWRDFPGEVVPRTGICPDCRQKQQALQEATK